MKTNRIITKVVTKDTHLNLILSTPKGYTSYSNLPFLPERMKIEKCGRLVYNLYGKKNYVLHIVKALKQKLNLGVMLISGLRIIEFNQEA